MKYVLSTLLLCFTVLSIAAISDASENRASQSHDFQLLPAAKAVQITGIVQSISREAGTIAVTKKFKETTIAVVAVADQKTKIMKGDQEKTLSDIAPGDKVILVYSKEGEKNRAKSIALQ